MNTATTKALMLSLLGYFSIALMSVCAKMLANLPTATVVFFQFGIAFLLTLPLVYKDGLTSLKTSQPWQLLIRALSGLFSMCAMFFAIKYIPLVNAVLLQNTVPLFVPLIVWLWLHKTINSKLWFSLLIGFLGIMLILKPNAAILNPAALIGLSAGFLSAISFVAVGVLKKTEPTNRILFYCFLIGSLVTCPMVIIKWQPLDFSQLLLLCGVGIFMYLAQIFITHAFQYAQASTLAPLNYLTVAFSGLLGWAIWGHIPDMFTFVGIMLVCLGGVVSITIEQRAKVINAAALE